MRLPCSSIVTAQPSSVKRRLRSAPMASSCPVGLSIATSLRNVSSRRSRSTASAFDCAVLTKVPPPAPQSRHRPTSRRSLPQNERMRECSPDPRKPVMTPCGSQNRHPWMVSCIRGNPIGADINLTRLVAKRRVFCLPKGDRHRLAPMHMGVATCISNGEDGERRDLVGGAGGTT